MKKIHQYLWDVNIGTVKSASAYDLCKAKQESRDFYEVLDYYLELIRQLHIRTYDYLGEMKASTNPLAYCERFSMADIWAVCENQAVVKIQQHLSESQHSTNCNAAQ